MIVNDAERLRDDYLSRLDAAMRDLPHGVAAEIRGGILEELHGLDAAATAARIARLGDPVEIAREARAEVPAPPVVVTVPAAPAKPPASSTRGFAIAAALTLSFGGFVVPLVGWVVGAVLVCMSTLWRTWEKAVAIVVPFVATALVAVGGLVAFSATGEVTSSESMGYGAEEVVNNPLLPAAYDLAWSGVVVICILLIPASGLWLLWRLRGR